MRFLCSNANIISKPNIAICQCYDLTICKLNYEIRLVYFKCDRNSVIREQVAYLVIGKVDPTEFVKITGTILRKDS